VYINYKKIKFKLTLISHLQLCSRSKSTNAHWKYGLYHILEFTYTFRSLLWPSTGCFTIIVVNYNNCPNCAIKPLNVTEHILSYAYVNKISDNIIVITGIIYVVVKNKYFANVWRAWIIRFNIKWFLLILYEQLLHFTSIPVKHPNGGHKNDRKV